jgi:hypothetical protein
MITGAALLYSLCLLASVVCAWLLLRSFRRTRAPLLLWSAACFGLLALNNLFVVADMLIFTGADLTFARQGTALAAVTVLLYGFIWEVE